MISTRWQHKNLSKATRILPKFTAATKIHLEIPLWPTESRRRRPKHRYRNSTAKTLSASNTITLSLNRTGTSLMATLVVYVGWGLAKVFSFKLPRILTGIPIENRHYALKLELPSRGH